MVKFSIGNVVVSSDVDDLTTVRRLAYEAWLQSLYSPDPGNGVPDTPPPLEEFRELALEEILRQRGQAREDYIPAIYAQSHALMTKEQQARAFVTDPSPSPDDYPALYGEEAEARGLSASEMATLILNRADEWRVASDAIEGGYVKARSAIEAATSHNEIIDILVSGIL